MHDFTLVSSYWDAELPEPEKSRLADHLAGCTLCQGWLRSIAGLTRTLVLFPHAPVPADFAAGVLNRLADAPAPAADLGAALRQLPGYTPKPDFLSRLLDRLPVCPAFTDLSAWHDGALSGPEAETVASHVPDCGPCQRKLTQLRRLSGFLQDLPRPLTTGATAIVLAAGLCPSRTELSAWLDGEAAPAERLSEHVAACGDCAQVTAQWRAVGAGMRALTVPAAPSVRPPCPEPVAFLTDGPLPVELQDHLQACAPCASRLARWEQLGVAMRALSAPGVPVDFADRVMAALPSCPPRLTLHAYLDDALSAEERLAVRAHLTACADCQRVHGTLAQVSRALGRLPAAPVPSGFAFGVAARIPAPAPTAAASAPRHRPSVLTWRWPTAVAAAAMVAGFLLYLQGPAGDQRQLASAEKKEQLAAIEPMTGGAGLDEVGMRSEDLLLADTGVESQPGILDEWSQQ